MRLGLIVLTLAAAFVLTTDARAASAAGNGLIPDCPSFSTCDTATVMAGTGNGSGTVTSSPVGINCTVTGGSQSGDCSYRFSWPSSQPQFIVYFTWSPAPGSEWRSGNLKGDGNPTTWKGDLAVTTAYWVNQAEFQLTKQTLTATRSGQGTGKVTSSPAGIDCGSTCVKDFDYSTKVTLTATPDAGALFKQWTGACAGQGATCTLAVTQATSTNAVFDLPSPGDTPTGGGNSTGGGSSPGSGQPVASPRANDTAVEADVIGARAGLSRIGMRIVQLELNLDEDVSATLTLLRGGKTLAVKHADRLKEGDRVLFLVVPAGVKKGKAAVEVVLKDAAGNTTSTARVVNVPHAIGSRSPKVHPTAQHRLHRPAPARMDAGR